MNFLKAIWIFCILSLVCESVSSNDLLTENKRIGEEPFSEFLYVQSDRDIYIAGERLFFKVYLFNHNDVAEDKYSSIVYLVLKSGNQKRIIESKVWLDNNSGFGQIYIPDTLSSGFYELSAFTNWMRGEFETLRFTKDIFIANRFDKDLVVNEDTIPNQKMKNINHSDKNSVFVGDSLSTLHLSLEGYTYRPRSKVKLNAIFNSSSVDDTLADASVSVMELNSGIKYDCNTIEDAYNLYRIKSNTKRQINYKIIETRGEIVSGKVINSLNEVVGNKTVYLSTPDTIVNLQYAITDSSGSFYFMLSNYYSGKDLFVGLMNANTSEDLSIIVDQKYDCSSVYRPSGKYRIPTAYIEKSQDIMTVNKSYEMEFARDISSGLNYFYCPMLYSEPDYVANTSDFLFLNQLDIMLQEMLHGVKVNMKKANAVSIIDPRLNLSYDNPMIFLDGVPFFRIFDINMYGSDKIRRLEIINSTWVLDNLVIKGILSIFTHKFEINNFKDSKYQVVIPNGAFLPRSVFISPNYSLEEKRDDIPDFRQLLYWNPTLKLRKNETKEIEFYTSDLCSDYIIKVEGFSSTGVPFCSTKMIKVVNEK